MPASPSLHSQAQVARHITPADHQEEGDRSATSGSGGSDGGRLSGEFDNFISSSGSDGGLPSGDFDDFISGSGSDGGLPSGDFDDFISGSGSDGGRPSGDFDDFISGSGSDGGLPSGDIDDFISGSGSDGGRPSGDIDDFISGSGSDSGRPSGDIDDFTSGGGSKDFTDLIGSGNSSASGKGKHGEAEGDQQRIRPPSTPEDAALLEWCHFPPKRAAPTPPFHHLDECASLYSCALGDKPEGPCWEDPGPARVL